MHRIYDYRPGLTSTEPNNTIEFPPASLPDMFSLLGKADRDILYAICFSLNMRSSAFTGILDNVPLKVREISSSVLLVCCHLRPSPYQGAQHHSLVAQEDGHLAMFSDHKHQADKNLITIVKSDRPGLHIRDFHGRWILMDGDLGPRGSSLSTLGLHCARQLLSF
ncbi:hypothetical protein IFM89_035748 [Coptis chinensis]|uniref:Uncharacterized protein n=1 Tax=Coptis chinensis TaxID=261450 RepID=A0A835H9N8_9MAGN|nr:hypothetical protein IFM89_035748 [Coptis chinensis]